MIVKALFTKAVLSHQTFQRIIAHTPRKSDVSQAVGFNPQLGHLITRGKAAAGHNCLGVLPVIA